MNKVPLYTKLIDTLTVIIAFIGIIIAFKIPGTIAFGPLIFALILGAISFFVLKKRKLRSVGNYVGLTLVILGIGLTLLFQTEEAEVIVEEEFIEKTEESAKEIEEEGEGGDLDEALDELDDEDFDF